MSKTVKQHEFCAIELDLPLREAIVYLQNRLESIPEEYRDSAHLEWDCSDYFTVKYTKPLTEEEIIEEELRREELKKMSIARHRKDIARSTAYIEELLK